MSIESREDEERTDDDGEPPVEPETPESGEADTPEAGSGDEGAEATPGEAADVDPTASEEPEGDRPAARRRPPRGSSEVPVSSPASPARRGGGSSRRRDASPRADRERAVEVRAQARYVRTAPRKARLVIDHIRGKDVEQARAILTLTTRAAAVDVLKLLDSAVANAENNHELVADELKVGRAYVDEGPTLKRYRPRALGRATQIRKRTSHMTIALTPKE